MKKDFPFAVSLEQPSELKEAAMSGYNVPACPNCATLHKQVERAEADTQIARDEIIALQADRKTLIDNLEASLAACAEMAVAYRAVGCEDALYKTNDSNPGTALLEELKRLRAVKEAAKAYIDALTINERDRNIIPSADGLRPLKAAYAKALAACGTEVLVQSIPVERTIPVKVKPLGRLKPIDAACEGREGKEPEA